ncbi:F-box only protein 8-like [Amphiura filiformis]|uniref:F-box only protein 8-like n=1 Tax=Amphiura filiformis TaxID=82378 RepID=UPI003B21E2B0
MGQAMRLYMRSDAGSIPMRARRRLPSFLDPGQKFPDLAEMPPELAMMVLSNLNPTELCLAMCVNDFWREMAKDELLWQGLCRATWGWVAAYERKDEPGFSFMELFMQLDEGTLTFNGDADVGIEYLTKRGIIEDTPVSIARFIHTTNRLDRWQVRNYLAKKHDILEELVSLETYANKFLPNALRGFFSNIQSPGHNTQQLQTLLDMFAQRFINCNPNCGLTKDGICILCYSLILLSVDLTSPHVKNKMSKREFIRNVRHATQEANDELSGHLYDNIYLLGHIAPERW